MRSRFTFRHAALLLAGAAPVSAQPYIARVLTQSTCCGAMHVDPAIAGAWGLTFDPSGSAWVAGNQSHLATTLDGFGAPQGLTVQIVPQPSGAVTALVHNPGSEFVVPDPLGSFGPARFLFATQDGTILGWVQRAAPPQNTLAPIVISTPGAVYTGLAIAQTTSGVRLYAANLFNARIDAFSGTLSPLTANFLDPVLPAGFAPFNIRVLGGRVLVAYGLRNTGGTNVLTGPASGIIDAFSLDGNFLSRLVTGGALNAPWGIALAPANFGPLSGALLVSNFGDGHINAFNPTTGAFLGALTDATGSPITIPGIRGIEFGSNLGNQPANTLFFCGSSAAVSGQFGRIDAIACYANCDGSTAAPVLNVNDFTCFLNRYAYSDPYANCDNSTAPPFLNVNDFSCFLNKYAAGCP